MSDFIPVYVPLYEGNEKRYLAECIESGWTSSEGSFVKKFESMMCELTKRDHGIAVSSGTAALEIAVRCLNLNEGDEILVPCFTIISCCNAIIKAGCQPVLIDVNPETFNVDVGQIQKKITDRTKAIVVPHIYGLPAEMDEILLVAKRNNLKVIEDAAQMHGQTYRDDPCGSFGDVSIFSFYANKLISIGEGGMVLTNDEQIALKARSLRNNCFGNQSRFFHDDIGSNMRLTNLQAAVGVAQVERLESFVKRKREIGSQYQKELIDVKGIRLPLHQTEYSTNIYWAFGIVLENGEKAEWMIGKLKERGIGSRSFFGPLHQQPIYQSMGLFEGEQFSVSEMLNLHGLYLPTGLNLKESQISYITQSIKEIMND